jgi:predicted nuclease with TOPRIM domain
MAMTMVREAWTDERLDDLKEHMDENFREVRADIRELRGEVSSVRGEVSSVKGEVGELREEVGELRGEMNAKFDGLTRTLQVGFGLIGSFLGVLTILIGTQL